MAWDDVIENPILTVEGWDAKIKEAGLHIKWPEQLREIHDLWKAKLPRVELDFMKAQVFSGYEVELDRDGEYIAVDRREERLAKIADCQRKIKRGNAVMKLCIEEERIRKALEAKGQVFDTPDQYKRDGSRLDVSKEEALSLPKKIEREPIGTTYYIDADSGSDGNAGTSTGAAWATLAKYTSGTTRSAGDIAILRRGTTAQYATSDATLSFDEDGSASNYIYVEADNANAFGDDVDLSATATATFTFGSKTVTYSSDISGVLSAGDWIYAAGDDAKLYAYMVKTVSTVTVTLYLPYKGGQAGSGRTTTNIGSTPVVGTLTDTTTNLNISNDNFWDVSGLHIKTNAVATAMDIDRTLKFRTRDMVLEIGTSVVTDGIRALTDRTRLFASKIIMLGVEIGVYTSNSILMELKDSFIDCENITNSIGIRLDGISDVAWDDVEVVNHDFGIYPFQQGSTKGRFRNCKLAGSIATVHSRTSAVYGYIHMEDDEQVVSKSAVYTDNDFADDDIIIESETTTVRSGGSNISIKVSPVTNLDEITLLDIPIYASTSAKTYTVYVKPDDTTEWTTDPTANELELSFEAWGHATNNHRKMNLSTDVVDFNGSSAWQALAVTVTPAQAGVGYLRLKYRKPKESGKTNIFYVDPLPVIS